MNKWLTSYFIVSLYADYAEQLQITLLNSGGVGHESHLQAE